MPTTLDSHPKLSPIYGIDRRSRMPTGTWSSSKTKPYLRDGSITKNAHGNLIVILTGWIDNQGYWRSRMPTAPNPHPNLSPTYEMDRWSRMSMAFNPHPKLSPTYGMDRQSRMPMGTLLLSKTKSYQLDGPKLHTGGRTTKVIYGWIENEVHLQVNGPK